MQPDHLVLFLTIFGAGVGQLRVEVALVIDVGVGADGGRVFVQRGRDGEVGGGALGSDERG